MINLCIVVLQNSVGRYNFFLNLTMTFLLNIKKYANEVANNFDAALAYFDWEREEEALMYARRGFDMLIDEDGITDFAKKYSGYAGTLICDAIRDICWQQFGFKW